MKKKLCILRARHNPAQPTIADAACIQMMMTNANNTAVLNYWANVTDDYLDFLDSALMPWVDITLNANDLSRHTQCRLAFEATKALPGALLDGFDGYVVLTWPGNLIVPNPMAGQAGQPPTITLWLDAGAGPVVNGKPACALPVMSSDHTFMCHEVGHVLGFQHTYGVMNNGVDWDGVAPFEQGEVYGDPYDIMSSATFGTRTLNPALSSYRGSPTFAGPAVVGWPNAGAFSMGPAPARAHVHLWEPAALPNARVRHLPAPAGGQTRRQTLHAAGSRQGVELAVFHPANEDAQGRGRCYVEFRRPAGWDAGLDLTGADLARQAVVIHTLADTAEGVRCWYRGRILLPLEVDADLQVAGTPLVVRVESLDLENGTVEIAVTTRVDRAAEIIARGREEIVDILNPTTMGTPCGDEITYGTFIIRTSVTYQPLGYGYGGVGAPDAQPLRVNWAVAGIPATGSGGRLTIATASGSFDVDYTLDAVSGTLTLASRAGDQVRADVTVTLAESNGSNPTSTGVVFDARGSYTGFAPGDIGILDRCMSRYAERANITLRDMLIPPGPDPTGLRWSDRVNQVRVHQAITEVVEVNPGVATAMTAIAAMRYGANGR
jgi:hypothetical protein